MQAKLKQDGYEEWQRWNPPIYLLRKSKGNPYHGVHGHFAPAPEITITSTGTRPDDLMLFNGNPNLAMLPSLRKGRNELFPPLPIRLKFGKHENRFGMDHIAKKHSVELAGYGMTAVEYVYHVIKNASKIYDVSRENKLLIECKGRPSGSMFIQLKEEHGFYSVVTTFDDIKGKNKGEEVWSGRNIVMTPANQEDPFEKATTTNQSARLFPIPDHRQSAETLPKSALAALGNQTNTIISKSKSKHNTPMRPAGLYLVRR